MNVIDQELAEIEARRTLPLSARERSVLRQKLDREHERWGRMCDADKLHGFDDGEPRRDY